MSEKRAPRSKKIEPARRSSDSGISGSSADGEGYKNDDDDIAIIGNSLYSIPLL